MAQTANKQEQTAGMNLYGGRCISCGRVVIRTSAEEGATRDAKHGEVYCAVCDVFSPCTRTAILHGDIAHERDVVTREIVAALIEA